MIFLGGEKGQSNLLDKPNNKEEELKACWSASNCSKIFVPFSNNYYSLCLKQSLLIVNCCNRVIQNCNRLSKTIN